MGLSGPRSRALDPLQPDQGREVARTTRGVTAADGSRDASRPRSSYVVFSQDGLFRLLSYRIVQRGPLFPETIEASFERETGRYDVRYRADEESAEERLTGTFGVPDDTYNGMLSLVAKNLPSDSGATVSIVAFTPKPRVVKLQVLPLAEERTQVGAAALPVTRYHFRPQLGLLASLLVVDIPDLRIWVLPGDAPAFLKAEGPLYFMGPIWRIEPH